MRRELDRRYPGWHFAGVDPEYERLLSHPRSAALAVGDFDGDTHRDVAVQVVQRQAGDSLQLVIVFLQRGGAYQPVVVDSFPVSTISYLATARPGEDRTDFDADANGESHRTMRRESLEIVYAEVGSTTCPYEGGRFRCFVSGD